MSARSGARLASILSPTIDFMCVGGLAMIVLIPLLIIGPAQLTIVGVGWAVWLQSLINTSHFMASYRIVYRDRATIRRYQWAAIWVPLILIAVAVVGVTVRPISHTVLTGFFAVASAYLAWHYTGQVWGMMASYTFLGGDKFEKAERRVIRASLGILLAWHVAWFLHVAMRHPEDIDPVYRLLGLAINLAVVVGMVGILMFRRRTGHFPPARAIVAWMSIFLWYAALAKWGPPALFFAQLFHSIQYLEFPARVELNRVTASAAGRAATRMLWYTGGLVAASLIVLLIVPGPAMSVVTKLFRVPPKTVGPIFALYFLNIHHYFTDGVIWKISNPEVRKELFAHVLKPTTPAVVAKPVVAPAGAGIGRERGEMIGV